MNPLKVILASGSPRRRQFLRGLHLAHAAIAVDIDETPRARERPRALVQRLAQAKAAVVAAARPPSERPLLVIGADTVVALEDEILGKPGDEDEAIAMLQKLRRQPHQVHSAVALVHVDAAGGRRSINRVNTTTVVMRAYTNAEIVQYVASGDPLDKAGAYAIQHREFNPVQVLDGCPASVMGLPLADLVELLAMFGVVVETPFPPVCRRLTGLPCCRNTVRHYPSP